MSEMISRSECESNLISFAVERNDMGFLLAEGIGPEFFDVYSSLSDRMFKVYTEESRVPSFNMISKKFPDIRLPSPPDERDVVDYKQNLRRHHAEQLFMEEIKAIRQDYMNDDWEKVLDESPDRMQQIRNVLKPRKIVDIIGDAGERYETFRKRSAGEIVCPSVFSHPDMNDYLAGMRGGDLIVYVSRPGVGKSWSALSDAFASWRNDVPVLFVSLEMMEDANGYRFDSMNTAHGRLPGFSNYNLGRGFAVKDNYEEVHRRADNATTEFADEYMNYIQELEEGRKNGTLAPIYMVTPKNAGGKLTPEYIHSLAKELKVGLVIVDYMMIVPWNNNSLDERGRLAEVSRSFKESAVELDVPYIVPHQLNRASEKENNVTLANFAAADAVGQNADIGIEVKKHGDLLVYNLLKVRGGPTNKKFAWKWDYDSGVREVASIVSLLDDEEDDE